MLLDKGITNMLLLSASQRQCSDLAFALQDVKPDLSNFDINSATSAWPYLIDDFVEYVRSKKLDSSENDVIMID